MSMNILIVGQAAEVPDDDAPPTPKIGAIAAKTPAEFAENFVRNKQNATVLVVDDDFDIADSLGSILEEAGYFVEKAHDGDQAIRRITDPDPEKPKIDCMLLDMMMPGVPGAAVHDYIRQSSRYRDLAILIISAKEFRDIGATSDENYIFLATSPAEVKRRERMARESGRPATPVFKKPLTHQIDLMLETIQRAIERKQGPHGEHRT